MEESSYQLRTDAAIRDLILEFECQPILFVGSGLPRRYFSAPNWKELLKNVFEMLPAGVEAFEYNNQKLDGNMVKVGTVLSDLVFEWAWGAGREKFPKNYYESGAKKDIFLKFLVCELMKKVTPETFEELDPTLVKEIRSFSQIKPHAIITTNYDIFLEKVFDGYEPITGQKIIRYNTNSFGEIFHIHGDVTEPQSLVLTQQDYDEWLEKKKYITAKLLTYFAEHPVFIVGYGLGDPNVKAILRDIGELVATDDGLISNVYQIIWTRDKLSSTPQEQYVFAVDGKQFRIKAVFANDLGWIFDALKSQSALRSINPKLVRALAARTMRLIRHDIPSGSVEVNYDTLERVAEEKDYLPNLLGITSVSNPNQSHPLTLTQVAKRIGLPNWHAVDKLINQIKRDTGIDIISSDNRYHCKIKTGTSAGSVARKWSNESVELFKRVNSGSSYQLSL